MTTWHVELNVVHDSVFWSYATNGLLDIRFKEQKRKFIGLYKNQSNEVTNWHRQNVWPVLHTEGAQKQISISNLLVINRLIMPLRQVCSEILNTSDTMGCIDFSANMYVSVARPGGLIIWRGRDVSNTSVDLWTTVPNWACNFTTWKRLIIVPTNQCWIPIWFQFERSLSKTPCAIWAAATPRSVCCSSSCWW